MLCRLCETALSNLIYRDVSTWRRLSDARWFAFKHGDYHTVTASAAAGCELCRLFNEIRRQRIRGLDELAEKWHRQHAMIDVHQTDGPCVFQLLTEAPEKSWIPFELFYPDRDERGKDIAVGLSFPLPSEIPPDVLSGGSIKTARRWIDACQYRHVCCGRRDSVLLPTRVVDVGDSDQAPIVRLLVNQSGNQYGQYVTLSHCWGTGEKLTTTKRNLEEFQQAIPVEMLPQTFQDAIVLTRLLRVRYLWLDALCIVQDDQEDWRKESARMCAVYENAAFSISAVSATDSDSGLFERQRDDTCVVDVDEMRIGVRPQLNSLGVALQRSKIESRAWCMQERILAPAILHVGPQQWYWECEAGEFSESCSAGYPSTYDNPAESDSTKFNRIPSNVSRGQLLEIWYNIVGQYSARDLTKPSDRLPAIAGLADKVKRELGDSSSYCCGLWADDFLTGLLWQRPIHHYRKLIPSRDHYSARVKHNQASGRFKHRVAPSWSWAAVRGGVTYAWKETYQIAEPSEQSDLQVIHLESDHPRIRVTGYIRRGTCRLRETMSVEKSKNDARVEATGNATFKPSGSLIVDEGVACILDDREDVIPKSCYCLRVSSWHRERDPKANRKTKVDTMGFYLILERLQGSIDDRSASPKAVDYLGRFRRIGMGFDRHRSVEAVFLNSERHTIEIA